MLLLLLRFWNASTQNCVLKTVLDLPDTMRIGNLGTCEAIHDIQSIDGCARLRVDARQRDLKIFAIKTASGRRKASPIGLVLESQ